MIASLVAAGGLAFTGISTYYGAKVADDQLDQSRGTAEEKSRAQASRISMWSEPSKSPISTKGVFANRSLDTVNILNLVFTASEFNDQTGETHDELYSPMILHPIQPCSKFTIETQDLRRSDGKRYLPEATDINVLLISFRDAKGKTWVRTNDGKLSPKEGYLEDIADLRKVLGHKIDVFKQLGETVQPNGLNPKGKPLEECGAGS
ncbi:hypothetical protein AB0952_21700 [Streptomyces caniferus]|uniref:hypothetical protein n=1 Tax=Streptomyces caniferus TaxID=285557 RepID=UPI003454CD35